MDTLRKTPELLTPAEMGESDRITVAGGVPGIVLMERAGAGVAEASEKLCPTRGRVKILCGPGGNGGDGFVAGRRLAERGFAVELYLLGDRATLKGDPALAALRYDGPALPGEAFDAAGADVVIDALYGAGLARDVGGAARRCLESIADSSARVVAVDVPSGIDGATGAVRGFAARADVTVTFHRFKPGHLLYPGREYCGELALVDIGISAAAMARVAPKTFANSPTLWGERLPRPGAASYKFSRGAALILTGGAHRTGAARIAARAALRVGAGLVALASPLESVAVNSVHVTAVMIEPFDGPTGFAKLLADVRRNAILLGPGAGVTADTRALVEAALTEPCERPRAVVIDADAISVFAGDSTALAALIGLERRATILTPHEGEFARLFRNRAEILAAPSKLAKARAAAAALGAVVVYKGADSVVASPDGRASIGFDLPPWLATAGSGDALAGFCCGLLAQGMPAFEAASAAVWLHGAAARAFGPGLIAEDIAEALPGVLRELWRV